MSSPFRTFINSQKNLSLSFDAALLPSALSRNGSQVFDQELVPGYLKPSMVVYDVGGGKNPNISAPQKSQLNLTIIGLDVSAEELALAPKGLYDRTVMADLSAPQNFKPEADLIICRALMEHVPDTGQALANMAALLKPGGVILIFAPCRNSAFAMVNRVMPEGFKRGLLRLFFPEYGARIGFRAYYDRCTPAGLAALAKVNGLEVVKLEAHYASHYFTFFAPAHIFWRGYQALARAIAGAQSCENFTAALKKV